MITIKKSCIPCECEMSESYAIQGDSKCKVYCIHPMVGKKYIGDTTWTTPDWCPVKEKGRG